MEELGTLVCLDVPTGTEFGVDLKSWTTGPKFKGVRAVPVGIRLIHTSSNEGGLAEPATGMFVDVSAKEVIAFRWNDGQLEAVAEFEAKGIEQAVRNLEFQENLGEYDAGGLRMWQALSGFVNKDCLGRMEINLCEEVNLKPKFTVLPNITLLVRALRSGFADDHTKNAQQEFLRNEDGSSLSPSQITELQFDPSPLVEKLVRKSYTGSFESLLGEIQASFILFLYLAAVSGLEFWKVSIHLLCNSSKLISDRPDWMNQFLPVLAAQLVMLPKDLFEDELLEDNFLVEALGNILRNSFASDSQELCSNAKLLRKGLQQRFGKSAVERMEQFEDQQEEEFLATCLANELVLSAESILSSEKEDCDGQLEHSQVEKDLEQRERMGWMLGP